MAVLARGEQRRLVDHVRQVGAGEPDGALGQAVQVGVVGQRLALGVHAQDLLAALQVRCGHRDLPVEAAGAQQRGVEDVGPVRRRDQDDPAARVEAVHLDEQLVERLLALVVTAAEAGATVAADRVDLVDEDDARRVLLGLFEQVADTRRTDTDEHLDEVRAGDRVERHARLTGDGAREQRLTGSGRAVEQHALRDLRAECLVAAGVLQEVLDLLELLDGLLGTRDVGERRLGHVLGQLLGLGLAEVQDAVPAALGVVHHPHEQQQQQAERHEVDQDLHQDRLLADLGLDRRLVAGLVEDGEDLVGRAGRELRDQAVAALDGRTVVEGQLGDAAPCPRSWLP